MLSIEVKPENNQKADLCTHEFPRPEETLSPRKTFIDNIFATVSVKKKNIVLLHCFICPLLPVSCSSWLVLYGHHISLSENQNEF